LPPPGDGGLDIGDRQLAGARRWEDVAAVRHGYVDALVQPVTLDPGITDTGWIPAELKEQWNRESPMGRVGMPEDAARLVRFLASEEAGWITGQVIHSRGGL